MNKAGKYPLKSFWKILLFALLLKSLLRPFKVSFEVSVPVTSDPSEIAAEIYSLKINKSESHPQLLVYGGGGGGTVCVCVHLRNKQELFTTWSSSSSVLFKVQVFHRNLFRGRSRQRGIQLGTAHL